MYAAAGATVTGAPAAELALGALAVVVVVVAVAVVAVAVVAAAAVENAVAVAVVDAVAVAGVCCNAPADAVARVASPPVCEEAFSRAPAAVADELVGSASVDLLVLLSAAGFSEAVDSAA